MPDPIDYRSRADHRGDSHEQTRREVGRVWRTLKLIAFVTFVAVVADPGDPVFAWDGPITLGGTFFLPLWWPLVLGLPLPLIAMARWAHARRRLSYGLCVICGYNLRATPDRCPECGTAAEAT